MKPLIHKDFLLETSEASRLYHEFAEHLPIVDFHCHLLPEEVAANKQWENITQIWLDDDHYKWRAMRSNGISEKYCSGNATDREKFDAFAATMPYLLRNPLYHWSHLELARYFGIDDLLLSPETADEIWERTSEIFKQGLSVKSIMAQSKVEIVCTTDDPADSLEHHDSVTNDYNLDVNMLPTWRPDQCLTVNDAQQWNTYIDKLGATAESNISSYDELIAALIKRHDYFHSKGCRLSDRGIDVFTFSETSKAEAQQLFDQLRKGVNLTPPEACKLRTALMLDLGRMDAEKGWTMQMHIGALRFTNTRNGKRHGFDSIDDRSYAAPLARFLDALDRDDQLPKTILYNLNPRDNEMMATMIGNFQDGITPGKIQLGSGWWFMDQKDGMERQIEALSQMGLLRRFVGMVTDSRSFLSYTRHEYFRRTLCNMLGNDMKKGLLPQDFALVGALVGDLCHGNASHFFGFSKVESPVLQTI